MAAAVAATQATTPIHLITDSEYVRNGIRTLISKEELEGDANNLDKWWHIHQHLRKIHRVDWIKGHRAPEQAAALGFREEDRLGNEEADVLATRGLTAHHEDADAVQLYKAHRTHLREIHKHILRQQTWLAELKLLTFGEEGEYYERAQQE